MPTESEKVRILREAMSKLLGVGHNFKAFAGTMLRWNEPGVDFSDEAARIVRLAGENHKVICAALAATAEPAEVEGGTMRCPICGIDEPHSLESLRAKLRETERDIEEREQIADGGMVRALESWLDLYEKAVDAHELADKRLTKHTYACDRKNAYDVGCICGLEAAEPATRDEAAPTLPCGCDGSGGPPFLGGYHFRECPLRAEHRAALLRFGEVVKEAMESAASISTWDGWHVTSPRIEWEPVDVAALLPEAK